MEFLLDTHSFLWYLHNDDRLPNSTKSVLRDKENQVFVSIASLWEISIKLSLGKLELEDPFESIPILMQEALFELLPIKHSHLAEVKVLPLHHRDPFDRLLIAQCRVEGLTFLTKDAWVKNYEVASLW